MFEQEAEEWVKTKGTDTITCLNEDIGWDDVCEQCFKDAAMFGYNKANEWHYVKDGDLPKVKSWVIGFYYGKANWHKLFYRADGKWWGEGQLCQPPYAWKEIVPPKE